MANSPQSKKRARQNPKRRLQNARLRSNMRTHIKQFKSSVDAATKDSKAAKPNISQLQSSIDKASSKGLIHKKKARRLKSRLIASAKKSATGN